LAKSLFLIRTTIKNFWKHSIIEVFFSCIHVLELPVIFYSNCKNNLKWHIFSTEYKTWESFKIVRCILISKKAWVWRCVYSRNSHPYCYAQSSYSAMLNVAEPVPPPVSVPFNSGNSIVIQYKRPTRHLSSSTNSINSE